MKLPLCKWKPRCVPRAEQCEVCHTVLSCPGLRESQPGQARVARDYISHMLRQTERSRTPSTFQIENATSRRQGRKRPPTRLTRADGLFKQFQGVVDQTDRSLEGSLPGVALTLLEQLRNPGKANVLSLVTNSIGQTGDSLNGRVLAPT